MVCQAGDLEVEGPLAAVGTLGGDGRQGHIWGLLSALESTGHSRLMYNEPSPPVVHQLCMLATCF